MKRTGLALAVMAIMTLLVGGVALASLPELVGTARDDTLRGTANAEAIRALAGKDLIEARGGGDRINTGRDNAQDEVYCGTGYDTVIANENDRIEGTPAKDVVLQGLQATCEKVVLRP